MFFAVKMTTYPELTFGSLVSYEEDIARLAEMFPNTIYFQAELVPPEEEGPTGPFYYLFFDDGDFSEIHLLKENDDGEAIIKSTQAQGNILFTADVVLPEVLECVMCRTIAKNMA